MDSVDPSQTAGPRARRQRPENGGAVRMRRLRFAAWLPVLALAGAAGARLLDLQFWPVELLWHFTETFFLLSIALALILLALSCYAAAAAAAVLALFFGFAANNVPGNPPAHPVSMLPTAQARASETGAAAQEAALRLVTHNLYVNNNRRDDLAAWLRRQDADVIVMQEVEPEMAAVMAQARDRYPHQVFGWPKIRSERPDRRDVNGLAVLSRYPLADPSVFRQTRFSAPVVITVLTLPEGTQVCLVVVHTPNPLRRSGLRSRNQLMAALADELNRYEGPLVVAGDFNATPYTPAFAHFLEATGLTTTHTYPGTYPQIAGAFGLPIDHVLVRHARIVEIEALDAFGSDHRPLRADLIIPTAKGGG
jgi:endonuclease/exonuclease/phosphatase (EEP) superfamily protein YafD